MIGVDTNVLVRYVVQDDPTQGRLAEQYLEQYCSAQSPGRISLIVLCELVWVLDSAYDYDRSVIAQVLEKVMGAAEFVVEHADVAQQALADYTTGVADFADCLIAFLNARAGAEYTVTFDRRAARHKLFKLLK